MSSTSDYSYLGKIAGTHGLQGHLSIEHNLPDFKQLKTLKHIFIEIRKESYIPYFFEQLKNIDQEGYAIVLFDDVNSIEDAKALTGKSIYVENEVFEKLNPQRAEMHLVGYTVWDEVHGELGPITQLEELPGQVLATVNWKGKELLVPIIDQTLKKINPHQKTLHVKLPDGLLDIYS